MPSTLTVVVLEAAYKAYHEAQDTKTYDGYHADQVRLWCDGVRDGRLSDDTFKVMEMLHEHSQCYPSKVSSP